MPSKTILVFVGVAFAAFLGLLGTTVPTFAASAEKVLYRFCSVTGCSDGQYPNGNLIFDAAGNLYGTTTSGGTSGADCDTNQGCGTVFELTKGTHGEWSEAVLYNFCTASACVDGAHPSSGLVFDTAGNLYGVTSGGGSGQLQRGTIYELTPGKNGKWSETVIYSFCSASGCTDGFWPFAGLIFDAAGACTEQPAAVVLARELSFS